MNGCYVAGMTSITNSIRTRNRKHSVGKVALAAALAAVFVGASAATPAVASQVHNHSATCNLAQGNIVALLSTANYTVNHYIDGYLRDSWYNSFAQKRVSYIYISTPTHNAQTYASAFILSDSFTCH